MDSGEITHEHAGANQRTWVVEWEAPISDSPVDFTVAGNIADGDHQPTDGDDWALASYRSTGDELRVSDAIRLHLVNIITVALFVLPLLYLVRSNKK